MMIKKKGKKLGGRIEIGKIVNDSEAILKNMDQISRIHEKMEAKGLGKDPNVLVTSGHPYGAMADAEELGIKSKKKQRKKRAK